MPSRSTHPRWPRVAFPTAPARLSVTITFSVRFGTEDDRFSLIWVTLAADVAFSAQTVDLRSSTKFGFTLCNEDPILAALPVKALEVLMAVQVR